MLFSKAGRRSLVKLLPRAMAVYKYLFLIVYLNDIQMKLNKGEAYLLSRVRFSFDLHRQSSS